PGEVQVAGVGEALLLGVRQERVEQVVGFLLGDGLSLHGVEFAPDAVGRGDADLDVQVGGIEPAHGAEQLLDVGRPVDHPRPFPVPGVVRRAGGECTRKGYSSTKIPYKPESFGASSFRAPVLRRWSFRRCVGYRSSPPPRSKKALKEKTRSVS